MNLNIRYSSFKDKIPREIFCCTYTTRQLQFDHFIRVHYLIQNTFISDVLKRNDWMLVGALLKIQSQDFKLHFDPCSVLISLATAGYNRRTDLMINELVIYQKLMLDRFSCGYEIEKHLN